MKDIPFSEAKTIADTYDKNQVIIVSWNKALGTTTVTTYGQSIEDSDHAAQGGDFIKKALGWPDSIPTLPDRVKTLLEALQKMLDMYWEGYADPQKAMKQYAALHPNSATATALTAIKKATE